jgi:hypothetical protein
MTDLTPLRTRGYQVVRGAIDPATVLAVGAYLADALATVQRDGPPPGQEDHVRSGHFPLDVRLSPRLWELPRRGELLAIVEQAVGAADICMHMPPAARFITPDNGDAAVPPHQDVSYNRHMPDFVTVWLPFVTIDAACGGVAVYDGARPRRELLDDHARGLWLKPVAADGGVRVECQPMEPGDILLLDQWIVHESMPNRSDRPRLSVDMRFFSAAKGSSKHYLDCRRWQVVAPAG